MEKKIIRYKNMLKASQTLDDFGEIEIGEEFTLKFREKLFTVLNPEGYEYERGPCLSIQLFHNNHFLKAISLPWSFMPTFIEKLNNLTQLKLNGE
ncbi:hypothetical protein ES703_87457 [subsurface metagenome]